MIVNFLVTIAVAVQLFLGQASIEFIAQLQEPQDHHQVWWVDPCLKFANDENEKDIDDYEDFWTENLYVHRVFLSNKKKALLLATSVEECWNIVERRLLEAGNYTTVILQITRVEF